MTITVRGVDEAAIKKIDEIAHQNGKSREAYLREYLKILSVFDEIKEMENRYLDIVNKQSLIIEENTRIMAQIRRELLLDD